MYRKRFENFVQAVSKIDELPIGAMLSIHGKPAIVVEHGGRKIIRFTAVHIPLPKWEPAAMRRASGD